jgi:hypothetical protein
MHVKIHVAQKIKRTNQMTNKDETNSLCGRKTIPPKSHKKVNHGDRVNATEL